MKLSLSLFLIFVFSTNSIAQCELDDWGSWNYWDETILHESFDNSNGLFLHYTK